MSTFDPARSQVSEDSLQRFLYEPLQVDVQSVPGIGPKAAEHLRAHGGVCTAHQLLGKFLLLCDDAMTQADHLDAFFNFLRECGIQSHRSGIVHAISQKADTLFPSSGYGI